MFNALFPHCDGFQKEFTCLHCLNKKLNSCVFCLVCTIMFANVGNDSVADNKSKDMYTQVVRYAFLYLAVQNKIILPD